MNPSLYDDIRNGKKNAEGDTEVRHSIKDLHYIVESNAYAPFVRNGSITIIGNRKIKRGCFVSIKWQSLDTPEIFYVESVSQNYSIANSSVQRTTSLTLSHGMMRDFMFDKIRTYIKDDEFRLILFNDRVYITNYEEILTLNNKRISVNSGTNLIVIKGEGLILNKLLDKEVLITGQIFTIEELYDK